MSPRFPSWTGPIRRYMRPIGAIGLLALWSLSAWSDPRVPTRSRVSTDRTPPDDPGQTAGGRVERGLTAYYPLMVGAGGAAPDRGPVPGRLDLSLSGGAEWIAGRNGIRLPGSGKLERRSAPELRQALASTHELTVEVWLRASILEQYGPARVLTFSKDPWSRNFMIGVDGADVRVRLRTTDTDDNGTPDVRFKDAVSTELEHYVVTFGAGLVSLYRNGVLFGAEERSGDLSNWATDYALVLGNETTDDRPWQGEIYQAAIYDRVLSDLEIQRNFEAGDDPAAGDGVTNRAPLIDAGPDTTLVQPLREVDLPGVARDDGLPADTLTATWTLLSGPAQPEFADATSPYTRARFPGPGEYRLELRATDGVLEAADEATVRVVDTSRSTRDLVAFYPLTEERGEIARDHSGRGVGPELELRDGATWLPGSGVFLPEDGLLRSESGAAALRHAVVARGEVTVEVWAQPGSLTQEQAQLLAFSERSYKDRNLGLGQDREGLTAHLRTTETNDDGRPRLRAPEAFTGGLRQYAASFDGRMLRLWVDGEEIAARPRAGLLDAWDPTLPLAVGGEGDGGHGWTGEIFLVAIYARALSGAELRRNFQVGGRDMQVGGFPAANQAPEAWAGDDRVVALPRNAIRLRGDAVDDGLPGETLNLRWTQLSGPAEAAFDDSSSVQPAISLPAPGEYRFELAANDGQFVMRDVATVRVLPESYPRLLDQSTWGPTDESLARLLEIGPEAFLDEQIAAPASEYPNDDIGGLDDVQDRFYYRAIYSDDQLRQRMAFALSKILVVSANAVGRRDQMVPYLRILDDHAFGNYLDLLREVTLSPTMGQFLDMVNNAAQSDEYPEPPNENYAREFLQLFTIGTELLNPDGTPATGGDGEPIPAYTEEHVIEFARAFTGWTYPTPPRGSLHWPNYEYYAGRMEPYEEHHDRGPKALLNGAALPAGQGARADLEAAIRNAFEHRNVGPFISRQLIQQLVSSHPSPAYVARVAAVFDDDGDGVRGNLAAVLKAILLDSEAQAASPSGGHLREPILFQIALLRALGVQTTLNNQLPGQGRDMGQWVFYPPSVFSYFSPNYRSPSGLLAPEFQLFTRGAALARANFVDEVVNDRLGSGAALDLRGWEPLAEDLDRLLDRVDAALYQGRMPDEVRLSARRAAQGAEEPRDRVLAAIYVAATAAEYQVQQ